MTEEKEAVEKELPDVKFDEFPIPDYETWKAEATALLKGGSFEKKLFTKTYEGITLRPMYTKEMAPSPEEISQLPGQGNYMRGTQAGGYLTQIWKISQQSNAVLPKDLNKLIKNELAKGSTAINIALDQPTRHGRTAAVLNDAAIAAGGVSISTLQDMHEVFQGIDLEKNTLYIDGGIAGAEIIALLLAVLKANGTASCKLQGVIGTDLLGVLAEEGELPDALERLYDKMAKTATWADANAPELRTILVQGMPYSDGGASAVQELGYALSTAIEYIRALQKRGLTIDAIAKQIQFSFSLGANFFMEIAKLRAARMLWAQIVESFGGNAEAQKMKIHAKTATFNKTHYDPYVNMLRTTTESFSAVIGGIDSLQVSPFDECIQIPDDFSRRIARNTQIILQNECNLLQPVDPAGGSWYVESLTQQVGEKAWQVLQDIEAKGGMLRALMAGSVQTDIMDVLVQRFKKLASRADRAVGVNMYANMLEQPLELRPVAALNIKRERQQEIDDFKQDIDQQQCHDRLAQLGRSIRSGDGALIPSLIEAFSAGADLAEVTAAGQQETAPFKIGSIVEKHRFTEQFEALRTKMRDYEAKHGEKLKIFLCNMGPIPQHKPRAEFSTGFLEVGGFEILRNDGFMTPQAAAQAAIESKAMAAVICSTDITYPELVPQVAKQIKETCPEMIVLLAGAPAPEFEQVYKDAGVTEFIHVRANCLKILTWLQVQGGIK